DRATPEMARGSLGPTNSLPARYPPISTYRLPRQKNDLEPDARTDGTRLAHRSSGAPTRQPDMENQPRPRIRQPCEPALTVANARIFENLTSGIFFERRRARSTACQSVGLPAARAPRAATRPPRRRER